MHGIYDQLQKENKLIDLQDQGEYIYNLVSNHESSSQYNECQYGLSSNAYLLQVDKETHGNQDKYIIIITSGGSNRHHLDTSQFLELLKTNF